MKKFLLALSLFLPACSFGQVDLAAFVDPKIGTGGHGHTYPGATMPFGMVQLSPDTRLSGWDGCSGYHASDNVIYGFSHTHLSGTGCSDYGDILLMPVNHSVGMANYGYAAAFSHNLESASPGYYSVELYMEKIKADLTATTRVGMHRYVFDQKSEMQGVVIDLKHRDEVLDAQLEWVDDHTLRGYRFSKAWAKDQRVYFEITFNRPIKACNMYNADMVKANSKVEKGKNIKALVEVDAAKNDTLLAKVAISGVDEKGAALNMQQELPGWDFAATRKAARDAWNKELNRIEVSGGTLSQMRTFYTALYHCLISPNVYSDVDGRYRGRDMRVHQATDGDQYSVFSLWDTYRGEHPLFTLIQQKRTNDFIKTFLRQYQEGGNLPVWELSANETGCMIGYHSIPVIVDAYLKGIRDYDVPKIYQAMLHSANSDDLGLASYKALGYVSSEADNESVSKTLEYAYDDWCIAQMASALGDDAVYARFMQRAQSFKNLYDRETGFMRARRNGGWFSPFNPTQVDNNYTEANSWQYSFYVPQDINAMMSMSGGRTGFAEKLDSLFHNNESLSGRVQADITGLIGQYAHGNEPSHHMAYLYDYCGQPWKTQALIHQICSTLYSDQADGLCGNEDCGQMSAWYVLSAMGFYPVCPGSGHYAIGTPSFPKVVIHPDGGKDFTILAGNISAENYYIQSATFNGKQYPISFITHEQIMSGGLLAFSMGSTPNEARATDESQIPVTSILLGTIVPAPIINSNGKNFHHNEPVTLTDLEPGVKIYYTTDGSTPTEHSTLYTDPFKLVGNMQVKALAIRNEVTKSVVVSSEFIALTGDKKITLNSNFAPQYTAGGAEALIDCQYGTANWRTGNWQGYHEVNFDAVIDLGKVKKVSTISADFLQDDNSWIWFPTKVEITWSSDGKN